MTPLVALLAGAVAVAAMLIALDPLLPAPRPRLRTLALVGLVSGMVSAVVMLGLARPSDSSYAFDAVKLTAAAITMAILAGTTATDIFRDRMLNAYLPLAGTVIVMILFAVHGEVSLHAMGLIATAGAGLLLFGGGLLFARLRGAPTDEATGEQVQDLGWGDVLTYALLGAFLGPVWGIMAFVVGIFANGLLAIPVFAYDRLRGRELMTHHLPMLPGITTGALLALLFFVAARP